MDEGEGPAPENAIRIVLADDDERFLESLRAQLEQQPKLSVVGCAKDGVELVTLVDEHRPDAVVIDLHMPQLDGVTAIGRLRESHPELTILVLTGDESPAIHKAVEEAGGHAVLLKGNVVDDLADRLAAAIPLF